MSTGKDATSDINIPMPKEVRRSHPPHANITDCRFS
jgi:hypothetical protein